MKTKDLLANPVGAGCSAKLGLRQVELSEVVVIDGEFKEPAPAKANQEAPAGQETFWGLMERSANVREAALIPLKDGGELTLFNRDGWRLLTQRIRENLRTWQNPQLAAALKPLWVEHAARCGSLPTLAAAAAFMPPPLRALAAEHGARCFIGRLVIDGLPNMVLIEFTTSISSRDAEAQAAALFKTLAFFSK